MTKKWDVWNTSKYLDTYFKELGDDTTKTIDFLIDELKSKNKHFGRALDFGAGPIIVGAAAIAPFVSEIDMCDYVDSNLDELKNWVNKKEPYFDWSAMFKYILGKEGKTHTKNEIVQEEEILRQKIRQIMKCDVTVQSPLCNINSKNKYSLIVSLFCADSITRSKANWKIYMRNMLNLLDQGGTVLIAALRNSTGYSVGDRVFPSPNINEVDLKKVLFDNGFANENISLSVSETPSCSEQGFSTIMFARGERV